MSRVPLLLSSFPLTSPLLSSSHQVHLLRDTAYRGLYAGDQGLGYPPGAAQHDAEQFGIPKVTIGIEQAAPSGSISSERQFRKRTGRCSAPRSALQDVATLMVLGSDALPVRPRLPDRIGAQ